MSTSINLVLTISKRFIELIHKCAYGMTTRFYFPVYLNNKMLFWWIMLNIAEKIHLFPAMIVTFKISMNHQKSILSLKFIFTSFCKPIDRFIFKKEKLTKLLKMYISMSANKIAKGVDQSITGKNRFLSCSFFRAMNNNQFS